MKNDDPRELFWNSIPLDELAKIQSVHPFDNISDFETIDDDPDQILDFIIKERHERRCSNRCE